PEAAARAGNEEFESLYHYLHKLGESSHEVRRSYWNLISTPVEQQAKAAARLRTELAEYEGWIPFDGSALRPRTLLIAETDKFLAYEVVVHVVDGVEAYGVLLIPRKVAGNSAARLPAVICQHGISGSPWYLAGLGDIPPYRDRSYNRYAQRLAERGYVIFAPYLTVPNADLIT